MRSDADVSGVDTNGSVSESREDVRSVRAELGITEEETERLFEVVKHLEIERKIQVKHLDELTVWIEMLKGLIRRAD
jgi:hypothetical protein